MKVYIPSYFNGLPKRKELFQKVVENYIQNSDFELVIYWMNAPEEQIINDRIKYIIKTDIVNASVARNYLLREFYNSDEEYGFFCDDDTILLRVDRIIKDEHFDCISYIQGEMVSSEVTHKINSSFMKIRNMKKCYNTELFFDESLDSNQDLDFGFNLKYNKRSVGVVRTPDILKNKSCSSMFKNNMDRIVKKGESQSYINKKWKNKKYIYIP